MKNQIKMDLSAIPKIAVTTNTQKTKWRNALQKYCDKQAQEKGETTGYCVCGWMSYCDKCRGSGEKNACVKAICELARENNLNINYNDFDFEKFIEKIEGD